MSFNATYTAEATNAKVVRIGELLTQIRSTSDSYTAGTARVRAILSGLRVIDGAYQEIIPLWSAADVQAVKTSAEATAIGAVQTALDSLLIVMADTLTTAPMTAAVDVGAGYSATATRAQKLAALNRSFDDAVISVPAPIRTAAGALRDAIDAFRAI